MRVMPDLVPGIHVPGTDFGFHGQIAPRADPAEVASTSFCYPPLIPINPYPDIPCLAQPLRHR
jgi:hypothetical protein